MPVIIKSSTHHHEVRESYSTKIPPAAPGVAVAEGLGDFHLIVTSDPAKMIAPVRMQVINAGADKLKSGQTLWFNLTKNPVSGTVGTETPKIQPGVCTTLNAPNTGNQGYPVKLFFRIPAENMAAREFSFLHSILLSRRQDRGECGWSVNFGRPCTR